jgi:hypothetical protein
LSCLSIRLAWTVVLLAMAVVGLSRVRAEEEGERSPALREGVRRETVIGHVRERCSRLLSREAAEIWEKVRARRGTGVR